MGCQTFANAQQFSTEKIGINVGVVLAIGTHIDRFGTVINFRYNATRFQFNTEARLYYNAKNLGPNKPSVETVLSIGGLYGYGKIDAA